MTVSATDDAGGFELILELDSDRLLPGRLVNGVLRISSRGGGDFRAARVSLGGTESWRYDETTMDAQGRPRTETRTGSEPLPNNPVALSGPLTLSAGQSRDFPFQLPVPELGPATFQGTELAVDWTVRANLDVPGFDPSVEMAVVVLQPTALLRAGVVTVAEFALYPAAEGEADGIRGSIWLDPSPLCVGAPFTGRLDLEMGAPRKVQEVRLELRVLAEATVSGGRKETITLWVGQLAGEGEFGGASKSFLFSSVLPEQWLPTIETPQGRADAQFHVIIATAWARDPHLVRDVAICSTTEI
ncbi:MAG: Arrestin (or S-antigen), N-terminal domain [Chloroflexota bacterium]|nr:Arrestin (or S-antigen), N-terminal domain [Chloroflexota bacterium]